MAKLSTALISVAIGMACLVLLYVVLMNRKTGHAIMLNGKLTDTSRVAAEALEREIRTGLPIGSPLATVQQFLASRGIEHSFEASSKTVYAIVNKLKGGSIFASKSLMFQFHFDDSLKLQSIDAKVLYTGP
jgi:hypothetical protein